MSITFSANKNFLSNGVKIGDKVVAPDGYIKNGDGTLPLEDYEIMFT